VSIASRLRGAFLLLTALMVAVVLVQLRALRQSAEGEAVLLGLAARQQTASSLMSLLGEMRLDARKYVATRDTGYLHRMSGSARVFSDSLSRIAAAPLTRVEQSSLEPVRLTWLAMTETQRRATAAGTPLRSSIGAAFRADSLVDSLRIATARFADAVRDATAAHRTQGERASLFAARVSLAIAAGTVLLAILLSTLLARSIGRPLHGIAQAADAVARGEFSHRLPEHGIPEITQLSRNMNAMAARLGDVDRMKGEFVSNVSHDLKTPLSSMQQTTDVLLDGLAGPLTDKQRQLLLYHRESGKRLSGMLAKLLELSRLEARNGMPHELLDLTGLARRAVEHVRAASDLRRDDGVRVELDAGGEWIAIRGDAEGIAQLLDNLLENATKFSPGGAVVTVRLGFDDGDAVLTVADEGPGVPDVDKLKVFERFHQGSAGRSAATRGVGLGLAICRQVVEAHRGRISVRDNTPRGALFEVRLPGALATPQYQSSVTREPAQHAV
jgi:two-component system sensor histidine kinase GlrK